MVPRGQRSILEHLKHRCFSSLPGFTIITLIVVLRLAGMLQTLEWSALDHLLRFRPPEPTDMEILIVGIDEKDIARLKTYPVPDGTIADLLETLHAYEPAVIGLDLYRDFAIEPGHDELVQQFNAIENIVVIEKALPDRAGYTIPPPATLSQTPEKVGFADALLDEDGRVRRNLLGTYTPEGDYKFSFSVRLAEKYLARRGIVLENGTRDPEAMRFGDTELIRVHANTGGYVRTDAGGNQVLINFRSGPQPFQRVSLADLQSGIVPPEWIRDRIVMVGIMALSAPDIANSAAVEGVNPGFIYGIEIQAHATSQIIHAVRHNRPLLRAWPDPWEYLWLVVAGLVGILLGQVFPPTLKSLLGFVAAIAILVTSAYGMLLLGVWLPVVPPLSGLILCFVATLVYQYNHALNVRINDQKFVIEQVFNIIHSGPLQDLEVLDHDVQTTGMVAAEQLHPKLTNLKRKLRSVRDYAAEILELEGNLFYFDTLLINLKRPTHQILAEVYNHTLSRNFPHFKTLRCTLSTFEDVDSYRLTCQQKRELCWFLEGALCNIGRHAEGVKRLEVVCRPERGRNVIRIIDNGIGFDPSREGQGTRQSKKIARQLQGDFRRIPNAPRGTICEISWPTSRQVKLPKSFWRRSRINA